MQGAAHIFGAVAPACPAKFGGRSELLMPPRARAGRYVMHSRPLAPSTWNSCGYCAKKCLRPWSVFFRYVRDACDRATPSMLRSRTPLPGDLMCSRHSLTTCSRVTPEASNSSTCLVVPSLLAIFLERSLLGRSAKRKISTYRSWVLAPEPVPGAAAEGPEFMGASMSFMCRSSRAARAAAGESNCTRAKPDGRPSRLSTNCTEPSSFKEAMCLPRKCLMSAAVAR
mmetsp:Transcript_31473/g.68947  ORF Transcript_31473/g.68947 Transcript_31473/m.68947 type:complete len:226 (-) Transcript_31473:941-1618(-)